MQCPALGKVPVTQDDLTIKATATGITFIHDRRFRKRYTGSKTCAVDINGNFWARSSELQKDVDSWAKDKQVKSKKKAGMPARSMLFDAAPGSVHTAICDENLEPGNISGEIPQNFHKKPRVKAYKINKREVRQRILGYINTAKGRKELYFWTVSFPEGTPDDVCYKAFNTWLTTLRTPQKTKSGKIMPRLINEYLWIAERQMGDRLTTDKNPTYTIHFHIAVPHYMPVTRVNAAMRTILKNLSKKGEMPGSVCDPRTGQTYYLPSVAKYNGVHLGRDKRTGKVINFAIKRSSRALANYLTKYITKNNAGEADKDGNVEVPAFTHLAWHNSRGFSCLFTAVTFSIGEFKKFGFGFFLNRPKVYRMEFATFVPWLFGPPPLLENHLYQLNSFVQSILD